MKNENRKSQDVSNLIYGRNTVIASLKENQVKTIYLQDHFSNKEILSLISEKNIKTIYCYDDCYFSYFIISIKR